MGRVLTGESFNSVIAALKQRSDPPGLAAAIQDLCYNALRGYGVFDIAVSRLLEKPIAAPSLRGLLITAVAELTARPHSAHAIVHQAVEAAALIGEPRAKGLVNAVLRGFQRRSKELLADIESTDTGHFRHPQWWIDKVRATYPHHWQDILLESNGRSPMTLRVNRRRLSAQQYLEKLRRAGMSARWLGAEAIILGKPLRLDSLPGFAEGEVSIQDAGAQRAAHFLQVRSGMRVLDACAAPGGKSGHILELADCDLTAIDADAVRARRIGENLSRLRLSARVVVGDCRELESYWEGRRFDRILLDAPCSASGVVRRHPDIKWLRRRADIPRFGRIQTEMLDAMWQALARDGKLLYATCSVFREENSEQIGAFLRRHPEATALPVPGLAEGQILPSADSDGFYYALLARRAE